MKLCLDFNPDKYHIWCGLSQALSNINRATTNSTIKTSHIPACLGSL